MQSECASQSGSNVRSRRGKAVHLVTKYDKKLAKQLAAGNFDEELKQKHDSVNPMPSKRDIRKVGVGVGVGDGDGVRSVIVSKFVAVSKSCIVPHMGCTTGVMTRSCPANSGKKSGFDVKSDTQFKAQSTRASQAMSVSC